MTTWPPGVSRSRGGGGVLSAQRRSQYVHARRYCRGWPVRRSGVSLTSKARTTWITSIAEVVLPECRSDARRAGLSTPLPLIDVMDRVLTFVDSQTGPRGCFRLRPGMGRGATRSRAGRIRSGELRSPSAALRGCGGLAQRLASSRQRQMLMPSDRCSTACFRASPSGLAVGPDKDTYLKGVQTLIGGRSTSRPRPWRRRFREQA